MNQDLIKKLRGAEHASDTATGGAGVAHVAYEPLTAEDRVACAVALARQQPADFPKVVCLCGSTRFKEAFERANQAETLAGRIVLSVGHFDRATPEMREQGKWAGITAEQKVALDVLHKQKIDLADEVLVLNVGGYIGDSTKSEVVHAWRTDKPVRWLEPELAWKGHDAWAEERAS